VKYKTIQKYQIQDIKYFFIIDKIISQYIVFLYADLSASNKRGAGSSQVHGLAVLSKQFTPRPRFGRAFGKR